MQLTGGEIIWECLVREGVEVVFGYPGGATLPTYDALNSYPQVYHVLTRHEQAAAHAADGYARACGKVGVAMATSGPGATNLVTGIATAMLDSSPIVCITGQVPTSVIGTDAFQETDMTGITLPITKHNYLVTRVEDLAQTIREAFHVARTGRPGPVLVDVPKDVQIAETEFAYPEDPFRLPGYRPKDSESLSREIQEAVELINDAQRPLVLAGHGVLMSNATKELITFAEKGNVPVALTLLGIGGFPASHPLCLGMMGMHGEAVANQAIQTADLILAFGMRFDDRVTGNLRTYGSNARKVHVDLDPSELNKVVEVDLAIVGDLRTVLEEMNPHVEARDRADWLAQVQTWREETNTRDILQRDPGATLLPAQVIHDLWAVTGGEAITVTDVGQHQMWVAQYYAHDRPPGLITSGGLGTMGFGLPAGVGAKFGRPDDEVWVVSGDGGFQMNSQELATLAQEDLDLKVAIINNGFLGMVRQWQEFFYERRYTATPLLGPDFCKLAEAYGVRALRVKTRDEVVPAIEEARKHRGPVIVDFWVEKEDNVYPMVPAGADLQNMIRRQRA